MQKRRFKTTLTFPERLTQEAERLRLEAATKPPGLERNQLLQKARQADVAAHVDDWVNSAGLRPPK